METTLLPKEFAVRPLLLLPLALLLALLAASPALGGGFATVGLSSTPAGVAPGDRWNVDITVLQHGRTPLVGVTPMVRIQSGGVSREFTAKATNTPGVYRATVVFPKAGRWSYEVLDGFISQVPHTFPPVEIGNGAGTAAGTAAATAAPPVPAAAAETGDGIATGWLWGAGAALLLALAVLGADLRRRAHGAMPHTSEPVA